MGDHMADEFVDEVKTLTGNVKQFHEETRRAVEEMRKENDRRLTELEKKGTVDPLLTEKVDKMSQVIAQAQERLDQTAVALQRMNRATDTLDGKANSFAAAHKFFQTVTGRRNPAIEIKAEQVDERAYQDYTRAFVRWLRKDKDLMEPEEVKALSVGSDPDGGYLVRPELSARIVEKIFESSPIRQLATVETISTNALEMLADKDDVTDGWVGETGTRSQATTPQFAKYMIPAHEVYSMPAATQTLLDDAGLDVEAWLARKVSNRMARTEATAFVLGDGVARPRGLTTYASGTTWGQIEQINSGHASEVKADGIISLAFSLKEPYAARSVFLMNRTTIAAVMKLKDGQGQYLWSMNFQQGQPATLSGYPVRFANDMAAIAANSLSIAFGDIGAGYTIVDRAGIRVLRDPYSTKPYVLFYTTRRVGGAVVDFDAIKLQKIAA